MGETSSKLFSEFSGVTKSEWLAKIESDLKGKPLDILEFKPEFDLDIKAYYHPEDFKERRLTNQAGDQTNNDWFVNEVFIDDNSKLTNKKILEKLNQGVTGLKLVLNADSNFDILFKDVLVEYIFVHLVFSTLSQVETFVSFSKDYNFGSCNLELAVLSDGLTEGTLTFKTTDLVNYYELTKTIQGANLVVSADCFGDFGASTVQELAIAMAQLHESFEVLMDHDISIETISNKIALNLSINGDYFVNIAKYRAVKELTMQLQKQWDIEQSAPWLNAITGIRNITHNDRYNNLLRQTTEAMSAISGGVNTVTIQPYSQVTDNEHNLSERLARNIQLILKEEAYFDKVIDPGSGSYYIESLTDQLIEKAWQLFIDIENQGGYLSAISNGYIHSLINKNRQDMVAQLNAHTQTLLGVNKYPNNMETWQNVDHQDSKKSVAFEGFTIFQLESNFEKTTK